MQNSGQFTLTELHPVCALTTLEFWLKSKSVMMSLQLVHNIYTPVKLYYLITISTYLGITVFMFSLDLCI